MLWLTSGVSVTWGWVGLGWVACRSSSVGGGEEEVVTASMDCLVKSWDVQAGRGRCVRHYEGHRRGVRVVTHSQDNSK